MVRRIDGLARGRGKIGVAMSLLDYLAPTQIKCPACQRPLFFFLEETTSRVHRKVYLCKRGHRVEEKTFFKRLAAPPAPP